jgi:hypothetical protein
VSDAKNRGSFVSIVTRHGLDDRGSISDGGGDFVFSSLPRSGRLWGLPVLLFTGYRGLFSLG